MKPNKRVKNSYVHRIFSSTWEIPSFMSLLYVCVSSLSAHDLIDECGQVGPLEGLLEAGHLVDDAAQRPDV